MNLRAAATAGVLYLLQSTIYIGWRQAKYINTTLLHVLSLSTRLTLLDRALMMCAEQRQMKVWNYLLPLTFALQNIVAILCWRPVVMNRWGHKRNRLQCNAVSLILPHIPLTCLRNMPIFPAIQSVSLPWRKETESWDIYTGHQHALVVRCRILKIFVVGWQVFDYGTGAVKMLVHGIAGTTLPDKQFHLLLNIK